MNLFKSNDDWLSKITNAIFSVSLFFLVPHWRMQKFFFFFDYIFSDDIRTNNLSNPDHGHFQKEGKQSKNEIISNKRESPKQNDIFHLPFMIPFEEVFFVQNNFIFFSACVLCVA